MIYQETLSAVQTSVSYTLANSDLSVKKYGVRLQPRKDNVCFGFYEEVVTVNPVSSLGPEVLTSLNDSDNLLPGLHIYHNPAIDFLNIYSTSSWPVRWQL